MSDTKVVIVGANGQLGTALKTLYPSARTVDAAELDITDRDAVGAFEWSGVELILNAAAFTHVDGAETPEGRIAAWKVNADAVANLVAVAAQFDATLVHVSSDYVFDGTKAPHLEDEAFAPLSVYGQSKAAGDIAASLAPKHYLLRTTWVVGKGNNFVKTMKSLADRGVSPSVVNDQLGRLTFTEDLAAAIKHLVDSGAEYGTYNFTNDGDVVSWADIAKETYKTFGHDESQVTGVTTEEYYRGKDGIAPRPLLSEMSLDKIKATGFNPRDWREAFAQYVEELKQEQ